MLHKLMGMNFQLSFVNNIDINKLGDDFLMRVEKNYDSNEQGKGRGFCDIGKDFTYVKCEDENVNINLLDYKKDGKVDIESGENSNPIRNFQVIVGNKKTKNSSGVKRNKSKYSGKKGQRGKQDKNKGNNIFLKIINDICVTIKSFMREIRNRLRNQK